MLPYRPWCMHDMSDKPKSPDDSDTGKPACNKPPKTPVPVIDSEDLFGNTREILIEHQGEVYRLQCTRSGKLILVK